MDESKAWFADRILVSTYESAFELARSLKNGSGFHQELPFERIFCDELSKHFDACFGKYWVIQPTIVNYGTIMVEDACEEYSRKSEDVDDY